MRYIETLLLQFRSETVRSNYGGVLNLAMDIVKGEDRPNQVLLRKLVWIKNNTTEKLRTNYYIVINTLARKIHHNLDAPIEIRVGRGRTVEYSLGELIAEIEEAHMKINDVVREVAKKYSLDIPFRKSGGEWEIPDIEKLMKEKTNEKLGE